MCHDRSLSSPPASTAAAVTLLLSRYYVTIPVIWAIEKPTACCLGLGMPVTPLLARARAAGTAAGSASLSQPDLERHSGTRRALVCQGAGGSCVAQLLSLLSASDLQCRALDHH